MMPDSVSTRIGLLKPNSAMLAAICETCVSECVRGFRAYGMSLSSDQCSIRLAPRKVCVIESRRRLPIRQHDYKRGFSTCKAL